MIHEKIEDILNQLGGDEDEVYIVCGTDKTRAAVAFHGEFKDLTILACQMVEQLMIQAPSAEDMMTMATMVSLSLLPKGDKHGRKRQGN